MPPYGRRFRYGKPQASPLSERRPASFASELDHDDFERFLRSVVRELPATYGPLEGELRRPRTFWEKARSAEAPPERVVEDQRDTESYRPPSSSSSSGARRKAVGRYARTSIERPLAGVEVQREIELSEGTVRGNNRTAQLFKTLANASAADTRKFNPAGGRVSVFGYPVSEYSSIASHSIRAGKRREVLFAKSHIGRRGVTARSKSLGKARMNHMGVEYTHMGKTYYI